MRKRLNNRKSVILLLVLSCIVLIAAFSQRAEAAVTGQETTQTLIGTRVGRYKLNYTGNTNHYTDWNTNGTPHVKRVFNDLGGSYANSSVAALNRSTSTSTIKYAYLVWETRSSQGPTSPVVLVAPNGSKSLQYPDYAINDWREAPDHSWGFQSLFCMATDVTAIVQNAGYGNYAVCNIPYYDNENPRVGGESPGSWQLIVVEEDDSFSVRAVKLDMGARFYMSTDFGSSLTLGNGLKSKSVGTATGQVFFGASSAGLDIAMTENVSTYNSIGWMLGQVVSNTTYSPGLYRNGNIVNNRDYDNGCIRMDLSDIDSNMGNNANRIDLTVQNNTWTTSFLLGMTVDIAYPDFSGTQTTTVNSSDSVTVSGSFTNTAATANTGIYNGNLTITLDNALSAQSASAVVNGTTTISPTSIAGNQVIFSGAAVASMMNGSTISYTVQCTANNGGKTKFENNAGFHGYLRADGTNTGYWIDRMWTAKSSGVPKYKVTVSCGNGIESVSGGGEYAYGSNVTIDAVVKGGYHWLGWNNGNFAVVQKYSFSMPNRDINVRADAKVNTYTIVFNPNSGAEITPIHSLTVRYDEEITLPNAADAYIKYTLDGVNVTQEVLSGAIVLNDAGVVVMMLDKETGVMMTPDGATVSEDGTIRKTNLDGTTTVTYPDGNVAIEYPDGTVVPVEGTETAENRTDETVENGTNETVGEMESAEDTEQDTTVEEDTESEQIETTDSPAETDGEDTASIKRNLAGRVATNDNQISAQANIVEGTQDVPQPNKKAYESVFMGWSLEGEKDTFVPQWTVNEPVNVSTIVDMAGKTNEDGAVITLYAVWDDCPWIVAENLYYTLEQAQSGFITDSEILSHATAYDREDGSPIAAGFYENGTSFSIPDYLPTDFTQFSHEGSVTENLTVVDSAGSTYVKQITVYVVDSTPVTVKPEGTTRFINEYYYNQPYEKGGLEENSVWLTNPEYAAALQTAFDNLKNDTPVQTYYFTHDVILQMQDYVDAHGIGNTKEPDALQNFYDQFMAPNLQE